MKKEFKDKLLDTIADLLFLLLVFCTVLCFVALVKLTPNEKIGNIVWASALVIYLVKIIVEAFFKKQKKIYLDAFTNVLCEKDNKPKKDRREYLVRRKASNLVRAKAHASGRNKTAEVVEKSTKKKRK